MRESIVDTISDRHPIGQRQRGAPARVVVTDAHPGAALRDCGQPVRIVPRVPYLCLPGNLHRRAPVRVVAAISDRTLRRRLRSEPVEKIRHARDRAGDRVGRPGQAVASIPCIADTALVAGPTISEASEGRAVQPVVLIDRHLAMPVSLLGEVRIPVICVGLRWRRAGLCAKSLKMLWPRNAIQRRITRGAVHL